jgi:hypothetical protein
VVQIKVGNVLTNLVTKGLSILCGRKFYVEPVNVEGRLYPHALNCPVSSANGTIFFHVPRKEITH